MRSIAAFTSLCLIACQLPVDPSANAVRNLRFVPSAFDSFLDNTEIRYTLEKPQRLSIYIVKVDSVGTWLVRTLATNIVETKGFHAHTWLGDNNNNQFAPPGVYVGVVEIPGKKFEAIVEIFHF